MILNIMFLQLLVSLKSPGTQFVTCLYYKYLGKKYWGKTDFVIGVDVSQRGFRALAAVMAHTVLSNFSF